MGEGKGVGKVWLVPLGPDGEPELSAMTEARGSTFSWGEGPEEDSGFGDSSKDDSDNRWDDMIAGSTNWSMELKFVDYGSGESRKLFALLAGMTEAEVQDMWDWAAERKKLKAILGGELIWGLV